MKISIITTTIIGLLIWVIGCINKFYRPSPQELPILKLGHSELLMGAYFESI